MSEFDDRLVGLAPEDPDDDDVREAELDADELDLLTEDQVSLVQLAFGQQSWRFGHVIVDEAQDLTPMQWRMIMRRARMRSMTIVGDMAQRTTGRPQDWKQILPDRLADIDQRDLTINYRSPSSINDLASSVLAELAPELRPSVSIRHRDGALEARSFGDRDELERIVIKERDQAEGRRVAVIGHKSHWVDVDGVSNLSPYDAKGLEFDVVVVVEPAQILRIEHGMSLLYVAITRATNRLVVAHQEQLPDLITAAIADS